MKAEDIMTEDPVSIDYDSTVSDAINTVKNNRVHELVVLRDGKPVGMLSPRALVERSVKLDEKVSKLMFVSPTLQKDDAVERVVGIFMLSGSRDLPVLERGKLVGVVSEMDVLGTVENGRKAEDVMRPIKYVSKVGESAVDARRKIINHKINRLPVIDGQGRLAGILSTIDLLDFVLPTKSWTRGGRKGDATGNKMGDVKIETLMQDRVYTVNPDHRLNDVIGVMKTNNVSSVIVVRGKEPVGIITPKCILGLMARPQLQSTELVVTGLSGNYIDKKYIVETVSRKAMPRMENLTEIISIVMDFKEHRKQESREKAKYEVKARVKASDGNFYATSVDWDLGRVTRDVLDKLTREIKKKLGKRA
ncbi:MAG: CBS domain-containing protein [Candidatus Aenigmarchaeota archaeon]|nr:CBS domain-containing protein [Candidatus Aenigmarchaeota archaeon]